jgi:hypothetical protein
MRAKKMWWRLEFGSVARLMLVFAFLWAGCGSSDDSETALSNSSDSGTISTVSSSNEPALANALEIVDSMLKEGDDVASIRTALVSELSNHPRVAGAGEDASGGVVWVDFLDGETHCILLIDESSDSGGSLTDSLAFPLRSEADIERWIDAAEEARRRQAIDQPDSFRMPGNDKALLLNSLEFIHINWDISKSTDVIEKMLKNRGYAVVHGKFVPSDFQHLTDYGVVVIEAHGTWRDPKYPAEMLQLPPGLGPVDTGTCGGSGSSMSVLTTMPVTAENMLRDYYNDLFCGRVVIWDVKLLQQDGKIKTQQFYGVTPNYVREHDSGTFPDNTLFLLNSCRGIRGDLTSPWRDMLYDKSTKGAWFLGWTGKVEYAKAARAVLHLFQLMTASNEKVEIKGRTVLSDATPPWGGLHTSLKHAFSEIDKKLYATDLASGAMLDRTVQDDETYDLILAPHPIEVYSPFYTDTMALDMYVESNPRVTIGGTVATVSWDGTDWELTAPVGAYGDIVVEEGGRTSMARTWHRWKPQIKVKGNKGAIQYEVTFTLHARASVNTFRQSIWDTPPPAGFQTRWDPDASFVSWTVSGQEVVDDIVVGADLYVTYSGSGLRALGSGEGGYITTKQNGSLVYLEVYAYITYIRTQKRENSSDPPTSKEEKHQVLVTRDDVILSSNWTVGAESYKQHVGWFGNAQVSWNAFSADPPFNNDTEPR